VKKLVLLAALLMTASPSRASDLFQQETLTGDWFGARPALEHAGVVLGADEIFDAMTNPTGGKKQGAAFEGRFEAFATVDLATALGWQGAILHANAYQIHGRGLSADDVGNLLTVGNIGATPSTRLFGLWLQQSLFHDAVSIRAGQIAADDEFFVSQYASLFVNSTFGWPSILGINLPSGGPAYPLATPGIRLRIALSPQWTATTAVLNGDPAPEGIGDPQRRNGSGTSLRTDGDALWISELAYAASLPIGGDTLPGSYKIGAWYHSGRFADQRLDATHLSLADPASNGEPTIHGGNFGGYMIADQLLWRRDASGDRGLGVFLRMGGAPADRNLIAFHIDGGVSYVGLLPGRDNDVIGFGMSYERVGGEQRALSCDVAAFSGIAEAPADFESAIELSYQAQIAPWWLVQPDAQLILHPGARVPDLDAPTAFVPANAVILGVRTAVSF
jgi:porin